MKKKKIILAAGITTIFCSAFWYFTPTDAFSWGSSSYSSSYSSSSSSYDSSRSSTSSSYSSWGSGSSLTEDDCRECHENLDRFTLLKYENPDKHHLLVKETIPYNTIAPDGSPGEEYECFSCHSIEEDIEGNFKINVERDCLQCHPLNSVTGAPRSSNVHHMSETYRRFSCNICHSIIGWGW